MSRVQINISSQRPTGLALDIAWSLWSELGVSGWKESGRVEAIDVEPLILFTAWLGDQDSRLWEESLDWCVTNHRFVSTARLQRLLRNADMDQVERFREYSATVRALAPKASWPEGGRARPVTLSRKTRVPRLERAALLQLRMRAMFGVTARSEVLRALLIDRPQGWSAAELAHQANYAKVNVAAALDLLALAGVVGVESVGTQFRYRLARAPRLMEFVGLVPSFQPDWSARFAVITELIRLEQIPTIKDPTAHAAQRVRTLRRIEPQLAQVGFSRLVPQPGDPDFSERFDGWANRLLNYWAGNHTPSDPSEAQYEVRRHESAWEAMIREPGRPERPLTLPDWDELYRERPRSDNLVSDDSTGAFHLAHELLRRAFLRVDVQLAPFRFQPDVLVFAEEQLRSMPPASSRTFGESFLRFWRTERVARMGISEATYQSVRK